MFSLLAGLKQLVVAIIGLTAAINRLTDVLQPPEVTSLNLRFDEPKDKGV